MAPTKASPTVTPSSFLTGLKVAELGNGVAGAVAGSVLSKLGAEVTRITGEQAGSDLLLRLLNADKLSVASGSEEAEELALLADIVLDDLVTGFAEPAGHLVDVAARNRSVWVSITPFGLDGPLAEKPGGNLVALAAGGLLSTIESADGQPVPPPGRLGLRLAGQVAALAALHGLDRFRGRGEPVHMDVSAQESVVFLGALPECAHLIFDCPGRAGSGRYVAPSGLFPCIDGLVRIAAIENHQWQGMVECLGHPEWTAGLDERETRAEQAELINARVTEWTKTQRKAECANVLQQNGVPSTPVNGPADLLESPQFQHRNFLTGLDMPEGHALGPGVPWVFEGNDEVSAESPEPRLAGLPVVELTHVLAGPIVGSLLGAMGAEVVRLEDLDRLDLYRRTGPFAGGIAGAERGAYFAVANHSKDSVAVHSHEVAARLDAILARSRVFIENVGESRLARVDAEPTDVARRHANLVVSVSGLGRTGPLSGYRVYANNVHAYGGLSDLTRDSDGEPAKLGTVLADPLSAMTAATAIAAWALSPCRAHGATLDLSMSEVVANAIGEYIVAASLGDVVRVADPVEPTGVFACEGGWLAVESDSEANWNKLLGELGNPPVTSSRTSTLAEELADRPVDQARGLLEAAGLAASPVMAAADLLADEHLEARGFFPPVEHPDLDIGHARLVGLPWRFAGEGPIPLRPPPALGNASEDSRWQTKENT